MQTLLVYSEIKSQRHRVFNFSSMNRAFMNQHSFIEKLDLVFDGLKREANLNVAFSFVLKNVGDGSCRFLFQRKLTHRWKGPISWLQKKV